MEEKISLIPLGGITNVTKNMYLYVYKNEVLIVDCGIGFADETMLGVDLMLPDISFLLDLLAQGKKIVGMAITHGHEDHMGALPYILPQLPQFPIYATPLTAGLANEKLKEFQIGQRIQAVEFNGGELKIGSFTISFIRVTHSVPDTSHVFIKTPLGNIYHGSDFKFDLTPYDGKKTDFQKIVSAGQQGIMCLLSDCLRSEKEGYTPSELTLSDSFEKEINKCEGKFFVTTYSSNISRLNQVVDVARKHGRKVCFVGRSLNRAKEVAQNLGYMKLERGLEVEIDQLRNFKDQNLALIVAGSQGQENSALTRIVGGENRDIKIGPKDTVVFSADPIPGNEISINSLIDNISQTGARVIYSDVFSDFHVSGHASSLEAMLLMELAKPKRLLPIGGTYRQMVAYKSLAKKQGYAPNDVILADNGLEVLLGQNSWNFGRKINLKNVYVDNVSGEEVESFVLRDRQKIAKEGVIVILVEIDGSTGQLANTPVVVIRGLSGQEAEDITKELQSLIKNVLSQKKEKIKNWIYVRKTLGDEAERYLSRHLKRRPLVLPVVMEV